MFYLVGQLRIAPRLSVGQISVRPTRTRKTLTSLEDECVLFDTDRLQASSQDIRCELAYQKISNDT